MPACDTYIIILYNLTEVIMAIKIFISPSNQNGNRYAYGDTTEDIECRKIAKALETALKRCGFETRVEQYIPAAQRCKNSDLWGADMHIPIHTNAFNGSVGGTRIFYGSTKGKAAAQAVFDFLAPITPGTSENVQQNTTWIEINQPKALSVYCECEFHDVPAYAKWIIEHPTEIGEAICQGVCKYYGYEYIEPTSGEPDIPANPTTLYRVQVGAFAVKSNAENYLETLKKAGYNGIIVESR